MREKQKTPIGDDRERFEYMDGVEASQGKRARPPLKTADPAAARACFRKQVPPHMRYISDVTQIPKGKIPKGLTSSDRLWFYFTLELTEPEKVALEFRLHEIDDVEKPRDRYVRGSRWSSNLCLRVTVMKKNIMVAKSDLEKIVGELVCKIVEEREQSAHK